MRKAAARAERFEARESRCLEDKRAFEPPQPRIYTQRLPA